MTAFSSQGSALCRGGAPPPPIVSFTVTRFIQGSTNRHDFQHRTSSGLLGQHHTFVELSCSTTASDFCRRHAHDDHLKHSAAPPTRHARDTITPQISTLDGKPSHSHTRERGKLRYWWKHNAHMMGLSEVYCCRSEVLCGVICPEAHKKMYSKKCIPSHSYSLLIAHSRARYTQIL